MELEVFQDNIRNKFRPKISFGDYSGKMNMNEYQMTDMNRVFSKYDLPDLETFACTKVTSPDGTQLQNSAKCGQSWCPADAIKTLMNHALRPAACLKKSMEHPPDYSRKCGDFEYAESTPKAVESHVNCQRAWKVSSGKNLDGELVTGYIIGEASMRAAIQANGPIVSIMRIPMGLRTDYEYTGATVYVPTPKDLEQWAKEDECMAEKGPECTDFSQSHVVVIGGFGTDTSSGLDFWIVLNSWGSSFRGEFVVNNIAYNKERKARGYFRLLRDSKDSFGVASSPSFVLTPEAVTP